MRLTRYHQKQYLWKHLVQSTSLGDWSVGPEMARKTEMANIELFIS